jgi:NADH dehydrogenase
MRVLVAGATGAVGTVLVPELRKSGIEVTPHVRPKTAEKHPMGKDPEALICDLGDVGKVDAAMARCQAVACLVGTMRSRFREGDTYEASDYLPVVELVESATRVPDGNRHFVLVSAYGARPGSGYLGWKFKAEEAVRGSGLRWTILRPSFLDTRGTGSMPSHGKDRVPPPIVGGAIKLLAVIPPLRGMSYDLRVIPVDVLSRAIRRILQQGEPAGSILTGRALWALAR